MARFIEQKLKDQVFTPPPRDTAMGSLLEAITDTFKEKNFQPTNINFGLIPPWPDDLRDKKLKKEKQIARAKEALRNWIQ